MYHENILRKKHFEMKGDLNKSREFDLRGNDMETTMSSAQFYRDNVLNPCIQSTYKLVNGLDLTKLSLL